MTAQARSLIARLSKLGYDVLYYRHGCMYVAGLGMRDTDWAKRIVRRAEA